MQIILSTPYLKVTMFFQYSYEMVSNSFFSKFLSFSNYLNLNGIIRDNINSYQGGSTMELLIFSGKSGSNIFESGIVIRTSALYLTACRRLKSHSLHNNNRAQLFSDKLRQSKAENYQHNWKNLTNRTDFLFPVASCQP